MAQDGFQDFDSYHLHREIRTLWLDGSSGLLTCQVREYEKTLFFEKGVIQWAKSNDPKDHLHGILVKSGFLTQNQLDSVSCGLKPSQIEGNDLVELGLITRQELKAGLAAVYYQIFSGCMGTRRGSFRFQSILPNIDIPKIRLAFPELFFKAILSIQDKPWLVSQFPPNLNFTWKKHPQKRRLNSGILPPYFEEDFEAFGRINGFRPLAFESGLDEFLLLKTLYGLQLLGFLTVDFPKTGTPDLALDHPTPHQTRPDPKPARRRLIPQDGQSVPRRAPAQRRTTESTRGSRQLVWLAIPLLLLAFFSILLMVTHTIANGSPSPMSPPVQPKTDIENRRAKDQNLKETTPKELKHTSIQEEPQQTRQQKTDRESRNLENQPTQNNPLVNSAKSGTHFKKNPQPLSQSLASGKQNPASYTIGIYLICQEENINKTLRTLQQHSEVFLVPKYFEKRDCYWVCWGQFPSRWQALRTISDLPDEFRNYEQQMTPYLIKDLRE